MVQKCIRTQIQILLPQIGSLGDHFRFTLNL